MWTEIRFFLQLIPYGDASSEVVSSRKIQKNVIPQRKKLFYFITWPILL